MQQKLTLLTKFKEIICNSISKLKYGYANYKTKMLIVVISIAIVIVSACLTLSVLHAVEKQKAIELQQTAELIQHQQLQEKTEQDSQRILDNVESMLEQLNEHTSDDETKTRAEYREELTVLYNQLSSLFQQNQQLEIETNSKIDALQAMQVRAESQAKSMQRQLTQIHKDVAPVTYLSPSVLPFQVEGISYWNGAPMVNLSLVDVNGSHYYRLMGQAETYHCGVNPSKATNCSNWTIKTIDVGSGIVIFNNQSGHMVKVNV